jgi:CRISPR-associated protein Cmr2
MSHLLAISIGPVQEWIAAARRTRDFWFGSLALSEISKAAALALPPKALIFPAAVDPRESIANVILAEVLNEAEAKDLSEKAAAAARAKWRQYADTARTRVKDHIRTEVWDEQVEDVIELSAAWTPLAGSYRQSRARLMRLLHGRKTCRNFAAVRGRAGVPKSSLDGSRESVWKSGFHPDDLKDDLAAALRLSRGEQLDCVAVTKRLGEDRSFPSVSRLAADPWIRGLARADRTMLENFRQACSQLGRILGRIDWKRFEDFPFEGTAIYRSRYPEIEEERGAKGRLNELAKKLEGLERLVGVPDPYLALLIADGDKMGERISLIASPDDHRKFSRDLASFASDARAIVEAHQGCLVYAGGDDVLALLPVDQAVRCARRLHDRFDDSVSHATLSVGIAIGHFMEPLEDLLEYAREAERDAKRPDRDGLAIHLHPRSGVPIKIRRPWSGDPDKRLDQWSKLLREGAISSKAAYALHELARDYENWPQGSNPGEAIADDAVRLLSRKGLSDDSKGKLRAVLEGAASYKGLNDLAEELLVARRISVAEAQAEGQRI